MNLIQFWGALELGLIYGLVAIGVYLSFRVIDFPDLTVDGSFPLGAAVAAALITSGVNPYLATFVAFLAGNVAGLITAFLNVKFKILGLLAGILTMTALYSINLRIMKQPNIPLLGNDTLFDTGNLDVILFTIVGSVTVLIIGILYSQFGLAIRSIGVNPLIARTNGIKVDRLTLLTLGFSNGVVAFAGALFAQSQGFADINIGAGTIIIGLASVIIGEAIIKTRNIGWLLFGCVLGSILYRIVIALALNTSSLGIRSSDIYLITALLVTGTIVIPQVQQKIRLKREEKA